MFSWLLGLLVPVAAMARAVVGDSVHTLQDVDVVGVRIAQRMVIGGQRLDGEALRRLDGGSVADALRYFAGVQLKDYGGVGGIIVHYLFFADIEDATVIRAGTELIDSIFWGV